jgi:membrane protein implicated in regulation of membrane protease activity
VRRTAVLAPVLFVLGLALVAVAVGALAGPWWGVLVAGVVLVALAVLTESGVRGASNAGSGS